MEEREYEKKQSYILIPISIIIIIIIVISTYKFYFEKEKDKKSVAFKSSLKKKKTLELKNELITVEVVGAVLNPGVYKLKSGATINDLIIKLKLQIKNKKKKIKNYFLLISLKYIILCRI